MEKLRQPLFFFLLLQYYIILGKLKYLKNYKYKNIKNEFFKISNELKAQKPKLN